MEQSSTASGPHNARGNSQPATQEQSNSGSPPAASTTSGTVSSVGKSPSRKRRKVTHACVYCRRSHMTCDDERPCTRCVKRHIGHLCHDEHRDPKKNKAEASVSENGNAVVAASKAEDQAGTSSQQQSNGSTPAVITETVGNNSMAGDQQIKQEPGMQGNNRRNGSGPSIAAPAAVSAPRRAQNFLGFTGWDLPSQQPTWNPYHQQWMFSAPELSNEFNLLSDFAGSFHDDTSFFNDTSILPDSGLMSMLDGNAGGNILTRTVDPIQRPGSVKPSERATESYYLMAADPSRESPEERMKQVLKAKLEAGLLKPYNYVKGYARLQAYMEKNMSPVSRRRIATQLERFRPKFRERTQKLTDLDLVHVEEWFEKTLLEYDRVFASMAVPACLWRRTGQIYRGNKEFAELINVPIEKMRDGSLTIYEIISEESAVGYWEKFGTIAFDPSQKAMLTTCQLLHPNAKEGEKKTINCCFSFTIRRDQYEIPSAIVGNFLPINPEDL